MDYIIDTHSLVWYFTDDSRLSNKALQAFHEEKRDTSQLSAIKKGNRKIIHEEKGNMTLK